MKSLGANKTRDKISFQSIQLALEVHKDYDAFLDRVLHGGIQVQRKKRELIYSLSDPVLRLLVDHIRFHLEYEQEEDDSFSGSLKEVDLVGYGPTLEALRMDLAEQLVDYAQEYEEEFQLYFNAPNRRQHYPMVVRVLLAKSIKEVEALID